MRSIVLIPLALCLAGCSVNIVMPVNRFDSPETIGQPGVVKGEFGTQGVAQIVLTEDPRSTTVPNVTNPTINSDRRMRVVGAYSALNSLDLEYRPPFGLSAKFQFIGSSYKSAKAGNFSVAASIGAKYALNQYPDPMSRDTIQMRLNETMIDVALITGFRVADAVLFYGGPFTTSDSFSGNWHDTTDISGSAKTTGLNAGVEFSASSFQGRIEYALGKTSSEDASKTVSSFGVSVGYLF